VDFADASLVWLADKTGVTDILTLDCRDFGAYRLSGGKAFKQVL
jgi:predicted nucleic acid-binding protein